MSLTFKKLREENVASSLEMFPQCQTWTPADWMTALVGEVGELANMLKKVKRGSRLKSELEDEMRKELADIQMYLDLLANNMGVDLEEAVIQKFNEVAKKRGNARRL